MKIVKYCILLVVLVTLSMQINAHEIESIEITVVLHPNGDATITELRSAIVDNRGTEGFIKIYNLDNMQVNNFNVSDEHSGNFNFQKQWDSSQSSRSFKTGKCGINETNLGFELCWGIGDVGSHHYKISYTVTNLVQSYTDCDGFNHNFYEAENTPAKNAVVTIVKENGQFSKEDVQSLTLAGIEGYIKLINGKIVAKSNSFDNGDEMILKCQFKKNVFHPVIKHDTKYEDYFFKKTIKKKLIGLLCYLPLILLVVIPFVHSRIQKKRFKRWFGVSKPVSPKISTEIPFNGDIQKFYGYLKAIDSRQASNGNKVAAFFVRMINNGDIELLDDGDNKVRIINPPATELPSSDETSYENVYHSLLSILWANSNEENIVYLDKVKINPYDNFESKKNDYENYEKFKRYYKIISNCPKIKASVITPEEAIAVLGLQKYLRETSIDYVNTTMTNGIPTTEYMDYECIFGMRKHENLNFVNLAFVLANKWKAYVNIKESNDSGGSGGSTGGGGSGFR